MQCTDMRIIGKGAFDKCGSLKEIIIPNGVEIIEDYAVLMAAIEEAAEGTYSSVEELKNNNQEVDEEEQEDMDKDIKIPEFLTKEDAAKDQRILNMVGGAAGLLVAFGLGIVAKSIVSRR